MCSPDAGCKIPALNRYSKLLSTTRSLFSRPTKKLTFLKANRWPFGPMHADGSPAEYSVQIIIGYIPPASGWIRDFHPLERALTGRIRKSSYHGPKGPR